GPSRSSWMEAEPAVSKARPSAFGAARRPQGVEARATRHTLAGSALWLMSSNLLYAACQWGTIIALAKLGAPVAIGHLGLALAIATPIILFTSLGLRTVQATDMVRRYAFVEYLSLRVACNFAAAGAIATAAALRV